ncbi:acyl-CoA synthetase [Gordonia defluvii]|uniref:Acyl-CoA synthetase n=1 Tax=Gordonia defluvii TaxID=283718 RepID=A0ABP6LLU8_9ACTN|nr:AMP-binding protein [Gordonia sp. UBA5067]
MYPPSIARGHPERPAYVMAGSGQRLSYGELDAESNRLAQFWWHHGVRPGDAVVIVMENNIWWPVAVAAGMRSGVYVTPVNWHLAVPELAALLAQAAPTAVVTSTGMAAVAVAALARGELKPTVISVDGPAPGCTDLATAVADVSAEPLADELLGARVLFSGGTTGRPKRFVQPLLGVHPAQAPPRHSDLVHRLGIDENTVLLSPAPNYHAAPFTFALITLAAGGTVVCMERFDAAAAMSAIVDYGVTHSQWVPTMLIRLLRLPQRESIALSPTHRAAFTSGAPCPPHVKTAIADWWGPILHEYYGASEGYGHTYIAPEDVRAHSGSVGKPLGNTRIHIVDDEGVEVPVGETGTVCFEAVKGGDSAATGPQLKEMGDLGRVDEDGFLYLLGRAGYMIISGGVNIYPEEIEAALSEHPAVADAGVVGVPDPEFGENVKAVVELRAGHHAEPAELIEHCRGRIAGFKVPRIVEFTTDLPRLPTGKLDKAALHARFAHPSARTHIPHQ